jgi:hypothetical protein
LEIHLSEIRRHDIILEVYKRNIKELYDTSMDLIEKKLDTDLY